MIDPSREAALRRLAEFLPQAPAYAARRNFAANDTVSRLSPALRHRLLLEEEAVSAALAAHPFSRVEKWIQEILWRTYWKGWLEMRPQVWDAYRTRVAVLRENLPQHVLARAAEMADGRSGVAVMDRFARELASTGWLHNHARMWWASFWIHVERLPWELGAAFLERHLLDADPASNTLSWRWVAGLQTPGKTYLVRRENLEKYCPDLDATGLERLEGVGPAAIEETADLTRHPLPEIPCELGSLDGPVGLWLHTDDLCAEIGPLAGASVSAILAIGEDHPFHREALDDGLSRASRHFRAAAETVSDERHFADRCAAHALRTVIAFEPFAGPARNQLAALRKACPGLTFVTVRRAWDARHFPAARAGFFPFWEKTRRHFA